MTILKILVDRESKSPTVYKIYLKLADSFGSRSQNRKKYFKTFLLLNESYKSIYQNVRNFDVINFGPYKKICKIDSFCINSKQSLKI